MRRWFTVIEASAKGGGGCCDFRCSHWMTEKSVIALRYKAGHAPSTFYSMYVIFI